MAMATYTPVTYYLDMELRELLETAVMLKSDAEDHPSE